MFKNEKFKIFVKKLQKIFNIFIDVLLYPLIFLSLISSMVSITARDNKEVSSIFGHSIVTILSGSMQAGGFDVGDIVFLKQTAPKALKDGDIIAFYQLYDSGDPSKSAMIKISFDNETVTFPEPSTTGKVTGNKTRADAIKDPDVKVIFHRIIGVFMAADGTVFFETKGDSNGSADKLIREDFVVGRHIKSPAFINNTLEYIVTPAGMFWVIILPLAIIVFLQIVELMTILFDMATEKKVLEGSLRYDSEESIKARVGKEMDIYNKVYFFDIAPANDKVAVANFLWQKIDKANPNKKESREREQAKEALKIYQKSRDAYWDYWIKGATSNHVRNKFIKLRRNANIIIKAKELNIKKDNLS